jgi:hypothetical protein
VGGGGIRGRSGRSVVTPPDFPLSARDRHECVMQAAAVLRGRGKRSRSPPVRSGEARGESEVGARLRCGLRNDYWGGAAVPLPAAVGK